MRTVVSAEAYGCVVGGEVAHNGHTLGLLRSDGFRPITPDGAAFLKQTGNPLHTSL